VPCHDVADHGFDRHGNRIWQQVHALLDDEHARYAVGSVLSPTAPVPNRRMSPPDTEATTARCGFRCAGCDHFRTDVSHLPDLTTYLDDLLRTRERLAAATGTDDWARTAATPSEQEISKIRRLINQIKGDIQTLAPHERAGIDEAVAVVRKHRAVSLGMPRLPQQTR
jgi:hypothetical protein